MGNGYCAVIQYLPRAPGPMYTALYHLPEPHLAASLQPCALHSAHSPLACYVGLLAAISYVDIRLQLRGSLFADTCACLHLYTSLFAAMYVSVCSYAYPYLHLYMPIISADGPLFCVRHSCHYTCFLVISIKVSWFPPNTAWSSMFRCVLFRI